MKFIDIVRYFINFFDYFQQLKILKFFRKILIRILFSLMLVLIMVKL